MQLATEYAQPPTFHLVIQNMPYISGETVTTSGQKVKETQVSKYIRHPLSQTANYAIIQLENSPKKTIAMYPGLYSRARVRLNGSTESGVNSSLDSSCFFLQVVLKIIKKPSDQISPIETTSSPEWQRSGQRQIPR